MGTQSTYHVIVIHQIHLPRITLNRAHERLCSLHPLIDRRLAQSLHLCCLKSPLNAPDLQQWVGCKPLFTLCCVHKSQQQSSNIYERNWLSLTMTTFVIYDKWRGAEPLWEFSWSMLLFQEKLACESHAMLVLNCTLFLCSQDVGNWRSMQRSQYKGERSVWLGKKVMPCVS